MTDATKNEIPEHRKPRLLALLFADWAADTQVGKPVVAGIFDSIKVMPENTVPHTFFIYVRAIETYLYPIEVRITDTMGIELGVLRIETAESAVLDKPIKVTQGSSQLSLVFNQFGIYWFTAFYNNEMLGKAPVLVSNMQETDDAST